MKVIQMQQNSEEWLEFRRGKSGGSEFKDLYVIELPLKTKMIESIEKYTGQPMSPADKRASSAELAGMLEPAELAGMLEPAELAELKLEQSPKKHYYEIIADRVARPITPNDYVDRLNGEAFSMLARGHILESEAAEAFAEKTGKKLYGDVVWVSDNDDNIYISPDRVVEGDTEAVEIKCLDNAKTIKAYLTGKYPDEYYGQILKYFIVNEKLETVHFVLYTDCIPGLELQVWEIKRTDVEADIEQAKIFEQKIMQRIESDAAKIAELGF